MKFRIFDIVWDQGELDAFNEAEIDAPDLPTVVVADFPDGRTATANADAYLSEKYGHSVQSYLVTESDEPELKVRLCVEGNVLRVRVDGKVFWEFVASNKEEAEEKAAGTIARWIAVGDRPTDIYDGGHFRYDERPRIFVQHPGGWTCCDFDRFQSMANRTGGHLDTRLYSENLTEEQLEEYRAANPFR